MKNITLVHWGLIKLVRMFKIELKKFNNSKLFLIGFIAIVFICVGTSIIELRSTRFSEDNTFFINFMLYNTSFAVIKFFIPAAIILLASSVWGGEYAGGMIKTYMLCKCKKSEMYLSKTLFITVCGILSVLSAFITFTTVCVLYNGADSINISSILDMTKIYSLAVVGLLPVSLLTSILSIILGDFQKSFAGGLVILILSLSADSISSEVFFSPTYFLSNSELVYYSQNDVKPFIVLILYVLILYCFGMFLFKKKDIWS